MQYSQLIIFMLHTQVYSLAIGKYMYKYSTMSCELLAGMHKLTSYYWYIISHLLHVTHYKRLYVSNETAMN